MRLYLRRKNHWTNDNMLHIADENGQMTYDLKSSTLLTKTISILDTNKKEVARAKQELKSLMPKYSVYVGDEKIMEVKKIFHPVLAKYEMSGNGWELEHKLMLHEHDILMNGQLVASVTNVRIEGHKACAIDIEDPRDELAVIAAVVAIDYGIEGETWKQDKK